MMATNANNAELTASIANFKTGYLSAKIVSIITITSYQDKIV